jgi:hypothetical protein
VEPCTIQENRVVDVAEQWLSGKRQLSFSVTAAEGRIERTLPFRMSFDETLGCREEAGTPVSEDYQVPFRFNSEIEKATIEPK